MSATLPYSSSYSMRATTPPLLFQRGQSTTMTTATAAPYQPQQQQQQHVAPSLGTVLLAPSSQYPPHHNSGYPPTTVAQTAPSSRPTSPSLLSHHSYPPQAAGAGRHTASMVPMSDAAAPPPTVPMTLPPSASTAYHQLVLPRSRPSTPTAPPQRNGSVAAPQPHPQQHYSGGAGSFYAAEQDPSSAQSMTTVHSAGWAPQYPSYPQQQQQQHAHLSSVVPTTVQASIDHYQAKVQQEQQQLQRLEFQEQAMLTEEQQLRATLAELERQRAQVGDEMALLNDQWARLWDQEEWLQVTPFVDLSAEIGAVEHNCNTLRHVLDDRQQELQGLEIELKRYEGNAALQERLLGSLQKVEQCAEKMESHRRTLQLRAEKLFEAETHRDRATQRHLADVTEAIRRCEGTLNIVGSTTTVAPSSSSLSRGPSVGNNNNYNNNSVPPLRSREGSVAADHGITTVPRTRMVSFGPSPVVPRRVGGAASSSSMMFGTAVEGGDSILLDTTTHDSYSSSYGGLAGESIAISLCGTKKPRRESLAA